MDAGTDDTLEPAAAPRKSIASLSAAALAKDKMIANQQKELDVRKAESVKSLKQAKESAHSLNHFRMLHTATARKLVETEEERSSQDTALAR